MFYIAIAGRPNVGKSTLFNRIVGGRPAIVDDTPGVTRDRIAAFSAWEGKKFGVMDTGGLDPEDDDVIMVKVREQAMVAVEEADVIFFVVDGRVGLTSLDEVVSQRLRKSGKRVFTVVNKMDGPFMEGSAGEFARLGFEGVFPISAEHNLGVGDLLSTALAEVSLEEEPEDGEEQSVIRIAVVGKPNVGKSSLVNRFLGGERMVVSDVPGTTRDAVDSAFTTADGRRWTLIDTAGIRRKSKVAAKLEKYSVIMAMKAIERADVALLVIDACEGAAVQEAKIGGLIDDAGKACVIVVNKWDAVEKDDRTTLRVEETIRNQVKFLAHAPVVFVSAVTGQRVDKILSTAVEVYGQYAKRLTTSALNAIVERAVARKTPPLAGTRRVKLYFSTQASVKPPSFVFMTNSPDDVHFSYRRYLANRIREEGGFELTPIRLTFRKPSGRRTGQDRTLESK